MSHGFVPVQWNHHKKLYDLIVLLAVLLFLAAFIISGLVAKAAGPIILTIRALGACAIVLLHVILIIGPMARLSDRFKPLLYNRRHLGVITALIAFAHGGLALLWYHGAGIINPLASAIGGYGDYGVPIEFPFEFLGIFALFILLVMAATSHDFWLSWLSPPVWKILHMGVYIAYVCLVGHVALGTAQLDTGKGLLIAITMGAFLVNLLHVLAIAKNTKLDSKTSALSGWINIGNPDKIPMNRAITIMPEFGERIAIFRHSKGFSAIEAVCSHQNGPLGEGCILDGLITCPWHGFQFDPETGAAPAPFEDRVKTHQLKYDEGALWVNTEPNDLGISAPALEVPNVR